jgi:hypothetical protein
MLAKGTAIGICATIPVMWLTNPGQQLLALSCLINWLRLPGLTLKNSGTAASRQR